MKLSFTKYPIDIILCILWSLFLIPFVLYDLNDVLRIVLGLPTILFIPGYVLVFSLFPTKNTKKGIDVIERIALSFGLSLAVVPLIGLGLNYTPWGIRLIPLLTTLIFFILTVGSIALYRWYLTESDERFIIKLNLSFPKEETRLDQALTIILVISILIAVVALVYVIITPKTGERFTEFYLLGPEGIADNYPREFTINEQAMVIVGIVNHEYKQMNYTVELWLVNQTYSYNQTAGKNMTTYHELWFLNSENITLDHTPVDIEASWQAQWEKNWTFSINRTGSYKLAFLLNIDASIDYSTFINYADIAGEKLNNAYRTTHLWITVTS